MKTEIGRLSTVRESNGGMELVKQEKFAGNEVDLYKDAEGNVYMTIDQLANTLEYSGRKSVENILLRNEYLKGIEFSVTDKLQATDNKYYKTTLLNEKGIVAVVSMCHRSLEVKNRVLKMVGRNNEVHNHFKSRDEDEYIHLIQSTFKSFNSEREVRIGSYRCDLLFPDFKLVIECDEYGHQGYDKESELEREMYIKNKGYSIIRFNPNAADFYIGDTLSNVLDFLIAVNEIDK